MYLENQIGSVSLGKIGTKIVAYEELMYCQSKQKLRSPKPSLPSVPPKRLVIKSTPFDDAFWVARQTTFTPFSNGNMYAGIIS